jgi:hypothetical protein
LFLPPPLLLSLLPFMLSVFPYHFFPLFILLSSPPLRVAWINFSNGRLIMWRRRIQQLILSLSNHTSLSSIQIWWTLSDCSGSPRKRIRRCHDNQALQYWGGGGRQVRFSQY